MFSTILFVAALIALMPTPAAAYLDPGTGSYITQVLIASLLGGLYAIKLSWSRVKLFFKKPSSKAQGEQTDKQ